MIQKNIIMSQSNKESIDAVISYSKTLIGIPYRWYRTGERLECDDKFWACNKQSVTAEYIKENDKCIVCTGLINLMRRYNGLTIPGLNENLPDTYKELGKSYPGGTSIWFIYLNENNRLQKLDTTKSYPKGTLLIAQYQNDHINQGHVAVVVNDVNDVNNVNNVNTIMDQQIIHSFATEPYAESFNLKNHGSTEIEQFCKSHNWVKGGYYEFVSLPEEWIVKD